MPIEWQLVVKGSHEIFGEKGVPVDCFNYSTHFFFKSLKDATDFINTHQECALQYHEYELSVT